jgi:1-acyl-sn-glycerol-3-phosphate acyltransferase
MPHPAATDTAGSLRGGAQPGFAGTLRLSMAILATARAVLELKAGRSRPRLLQAWSSRVLRALRIELTVEGALSDGARLWAANHLSWLDPLVLFSLRPSGVLAKREVAGYPMIGAAASGAGLRFVDRDDPTSRAAALAATVEELRRGHDFLLFPEGTTTRGHHLGRVHTGGLLAAHRLGVATLPLRLDCDAPHYPWVGDDTLPPHLQALAAGPPIRIRIRPGPCLHPGDFADPYEWLGVIRRQLAPR